jgi:hypothetical protein
MKLRNFESFENQLREGHPLHMDANKTAGKCAE